MRIGFIGSGAMASAIAHGVAASGGERDIVVTDVVPAAAERLASGVGGTAVPDAAALVREVGPGGLVVVSVKPHVVLGVLDQVREALAETGAPVVSIAAGLQLSTLTAAVPDGHPVVRVMPNVAAQVGVGAAAVCGNEATTEEQVSAVVDLFEAVGTAEVLEERLFGAFTAIAGSSPAFVFQLIDSLARAAVAAGMPKAQAVRIAAQAAAGAGTLARELAAEGTSPQDLVDRVCSPGGTTVAGMVALDAAGFPAAVVSGANAVMTRDAELSGD
ncbi:pyrroline-5-carboxylate reductase [Georgenia sp. Z1344]|uniref:pyrroline-5-carboxylate reductase n=1 Tax=Georgenia sp. Z1344 TaxID=3416706 RepID=UPI003CF24E75